MKPHDTFLAPLLRAMRPSWRVGLALSMCGLGACTRVDDPPPIPDGPPIEAPFAASVQRGVTGEQGVIGGSWGYHPMAYSARFHRSFEPVTTLRAPPTHSRILRITVPAGAGPPLEGYSDTWGLCEVEVRGPDGDNLARDATATSESDTESIAMINDGVRVGSWEERSWRCDPTRDGVSSRSLELRWLRPIEWTSLVFHWPTTRGPGPWHGDPTIDIGYAPARLVVQSWHGGVWTTVDTHPVTHGARGDGPFVRERLGLAHTPTDRDAHLDELDRWFPLDARDASPPPTTGVSLAVRDLALHVDASEVRHGATDFARWMRGSFGLDVVVSTGAPTTPHIAVGVLDELPPVMASRIGGDALDAFRAFADRPESFAIFPSGDVVDVVGIDAMGARFGLSRLIHRMTDRGRPDIPDTIDMRRPAVFPRAMSGVSLGRNGPDGLGFSDEYLDLMTRYTLDAIYIFQAAPYFEVTGTVGSSIDARVNPDREKIAQLRRLIARAGERGLGVYWCVALPGVFPPGVYRAVPAIRGANPAPSVVCLSTAEGREVVEDAARRIARELPGLRGLVVLRSEFSHTCGGRARCEGCARSHGPDSDPVQSIFGWVSAAAREVAPALEVIAMDWRAGGLPAVDGSRLPSGVDLWMRPGRLHRGSPENDIRDTRPSPAFRDQVARAGSRRVWVEDQITHPFPFHVFPELPAADLYWDRWTRLLAMTPDRPFAFGGGNGSGFVPTTMTDLVFRELFWEPLDDREVVLERVAARWFGDAAAGEARRAWWEMSNALVEHAHFSKYVSRAAYVSPLGFDDLNLTADNTASMKLLRSAWDAAVRRFERAAEAAPPERRRGAGRIADSARLTRAGIASLDHAMQFTDATRALRREGVGGNEARARLLDLMARELVTVDSTIAIASRRSLVRRHPFYRNRFELQPLVEKRRAIARLSEQIGRR